MAAVERRRARNGRPILAGMAGLVAACAACNALLGNESGEVAALAEAGASSSSGSSGTGGSSGAADGGVMSSSSSGSSGGGGSSSGGPPVEALGPGRAVAVTDRSLVIVTLEGTVRHTALDGTSDDSDFTFASQGGQLVPAVAAVASRPTPDGVLGRIMVMVQDERLFDCGPSQCTPYPYVPQPRSLTAAAGGILLSSEAEGTPSNLVLLTAPMAVPVVVRDAVASTLLAANASRYFYAYDRQSVSFGSYGGGVPGSELVLVPGTGALSALAASETDAYLAGRCEVGSICAFTLGDSTGAHPFRSIYAPAVSAAPSNVRELFIDDTTLYWSAQYETRATTSRCDLTAGCTETATEIMPVMVTSFSRNSQHVYFAANGAIYRVAR